MFDLKVTKGKGKAIHAGGYTLLHHKLVTACSPWAGSGDTGITEAPEGSQVTCKTCLRSI